MNLLLNHPPGVDAGWPFPFEFSHARSRATQAECSAAQLVLEQADIAI